MHANGLREMVATTPARRLAGGAVRRSNIRASLESGRTTGRSRTDRDGRGGPPRRQSRPLTLPVDLGILKPRLPMLLGGTAGLVLAVVVLGLAARAATGGEVYPNVRVYDVALGGLEEDDATRSLTERTGLLAAQPATLVFEGRTWTATPADLGVGYDVDGSVAAAMAVGREGGPIGGVLRGVGLGGGEVTVPLGVTFDHGRFDAFLDTVESEIAVAPVDANVAVSGTEVTLIPAQDGRGIERERLRGELLRQVGALLPVSLALEIVVRTPAISNEAAAAATAQVRQALVAPLVLTHGDESWELPVAEFGPLLRLVPTTVGGPGVGIALEEGGLRNRLAALVAAIDAEPADAAISDDGFHRRLTPAVTGRRVRIDELASAVQTAVATGQRAVVVPLDETHPGVTTAAVLDGYGVTDLLATGTSDFAGSDEKRVNNVLVATELMDGVLVPPKGEFSYNHAIGSIVAVPAFVPAGSSEGGIPGTSVGGGVCQISTSVFRAALNAGMPILEWWPHAFRMSYYEQGGWDAGFDASIAQPDVDPLNGSDFRFANPTDDWILVRAAIRDQTISVVELFGTPTGFDVTIEDIRYANEQPAGGWTEEIDPTLPPGSAILTQPARSGITVSFVRRVTDANGVEVSTDTFVSEYRPQGEVYRVSPDMAGGAFFS